MRRKTPSASTHSPRSHNRCKEAIVVLSCYSAVHGQVKRYTRVTRETLARRSREKLRVRVCEHYSRSRVRTRYSSTRATRARARARVLAVARARAREYCTCNSSLVYTTKRVTVCYLHCGGTKGKCAKMHLVSKISRWPTRIL